MESHGWRSLGTGLVDVTTAGNVASVQADSAVVHTCVVLHAIASPQLPALPDSDKKVSFFFRDGLKKC